MDVLKKVPIREQEPKVRAANFEEVCLGYTSGRSTGGGVPLLKLQERKVRTGLSGIHQYPKIYFRGKRGKLCGCSRYHC